MAEQQLLQPYHHQSTRKTRSSEKFEGLINHYCNSENMVAIILNIPVDDPVVASRLNFKKWYVGNNNASKKNLDRIVEIIANSRTINLDNKFE